MWKRIKKGGGGLGNYDRFGHIRATIYADVENDIGGGGGGGGGIMINLAT